MTAIRIEDHPSRRTDLIDRDGSDFQVLFANEDYRSSDQQLATEDEEKKRKKKGKKKKREKRKEKRATRQSRRNGNPRMNQVNS